MESSNPLERMRNIGSICEHLRHLYGLTGALNRIAKALKMVPININIESCRADESRDSFSVLSKEIRELSDTVASLARTLRGRGVPRLTSGGRTRGRGNLRARVVARRLAHLGIEHSIFETEAIVQSLSRMIVLNCILQRNHSYRKD